MKLNELYYKQIEELKQSIIRRNGLITFNTDKNYKLYVQDINFPPMEYDEQFNALVNMIHMIKIKRGRYLLLFIGYNTEILPIDITEFLDYYKLERDENLLKLPYLKDYKLFFKDLGITAIINYLEV